jgi:carboxypeptidase T
MNTMRLLLPVLILGGLLVLPSFSAMNLSVDLRDVPGNDFHDDTFQEETRTSVSLESGIYHSYNEMTDLFIQLSEEYSDIMSLESLGVTFEGRDIWLVKLSDHVEVDEEEPEVFLIGAHHGNEKPSYEVLIYFIQHMVGNYSKPNTDDDGDGMVNEDPIDGVDNDEDGLIDEDPSEDRVREVLNSTEIYLMPMMNPDGVEAGTRKNQAPNYGPFGFQQEITSYGVDLNRNYGYRWMFLFIFPKYYLRSTHYLDSSNVYRGERPFCEEETKAIRVFVNTHDIQICLTYHTYGEWILYPWGHTTLPARDKQVFISIGEGIQAINQYVLAQSVNLYPTLGDTCDWMYGRKRIIPYTIELGQEYAPQNPEILKEMSHTHVGVNLYVCEQAQIQNLQN